MTDQELQKLKEKLAMWAEFTQITRKEAYDIGHYTLWENALGYSHGELPDFPNSLDACFKWLVPKLRITHHIHFHSYDGKVDWRVVLSNTNETIYGRHNEPALALCLAIEKLIDAEKT